MGIFGSKVAALDIPFLVKMLSECQVPVDRNQALDYLEQIDQNLLDKKTLDAQAALFKDADGMRMVVKVGKRLVDDIDFISAVINVVEDVKLNTPLMMDFIQWGGVDMLEKTMRVHAKDEFLVSTLPKLIKIILAVGAAASIQEIEQEGLNLLLCKNCQEIIIRDKNPYSIAKVSVPRPAERINRVLRFMDNFMLRLDVQIAALNAVIKFARNSDASETAKDTEVFTVVAKCVTTHAGETAILWRATMAFTTLAAYKSELAVAVMATGIHETLIAVYPELQEHRLVQQQILWLFAALLRWPRSKKLLHKSAVSMDFFKSLCGDPLEDKKAAKRRLQQLQWEKEERQRQLDLQKLNGDGNESVASGAGPQTLNTGNMNTTNHHHNNNSISTMTKQNNATTLGNNSEVQSKGGKSKGSKSSKSGKSKGIKGLNQNDPDEEDAPQVQGSEIEVAIPVQMRAFVRETQGRLYRDKSAGNEKNKNIPQKPRRNFDEVAPIFGTVSTRIFLPGQEGLVTTKEEEAKANNADKVTVPDWEKRLNYGEELTAEERKAQKREKERLQRQREADERGG